MMANNHINELIATDELFQLIQKENFVGWVFSLDYDNALVVTNDAWKYAVKGIPHNAFLLASTFTPDNYADVDEMDREVVLLRVMGTCKLPQDDDAIKTKLDSYQNLTELYPTQGREDFDAITKNKLQFGAAPCRWRPSARKRHTVRGNSPHRTARRTPPGRDRRPPAPRACLRTRDS